MVEEPELIYVDAIVMAERNIIGCGEKNRALLFFKERVASMVNKVLRTVGCPECKALFQDSFQ